MYKANLSHYQLLKYLEILMSKKLLTYDSEVYQTTKKGLLFIEEFKKIEVLMEDTSSTPNNYTTELQAMLIQSHKSS